MSSTLGSPTKTCWKRRSRAGSFSMRSRYSSRVVAPIRRSSPRASIGLSMLPASMAESPPAPAPTTVCSSSMKVITWPSELLISSRTALSRSSNSPRYFAPATIAARSRLSTRRPLRESGTSPATTRCARPSTTAVLPTPGSPISTGLFLVRRDSTCTTRRISASRPITGSSLPSSARSVRSTAYFSSASYVASASWLVTRRLPRTAVIASRTEASVAPADTSRSRTGVSTTVSARSRCSVATYSSPISWIRSSDLASTRVSEAEAPGVETVEPEAFGSWRTAWSRARLTSAGSAPALVSSDGVIPRSWRSSATARWAGSTWGVPSLTASVLAALITSTLREVSLDASTDMAPCVGGDSTSIATPPKLSAFPSTLGRVGQVGRCPPPRHSGVVGYSTVFISSAAYMNLQRAMSRFTGMRTVYIVRIDHPKRDLPR